MLGLFGDELGIPKNKDSRNVFALIGASNHTQEDREENDLYCTHPDAVDALCRIETFSHHIWEPCAGLGHIAAALRMHGYDVRESDLLTRGRNIEKKDFLLCDEKENCDIITNPPYRIATAIIRKAMDVVSDGNKVAMFLRILFLESIERKCLFEQYPPIRVWISSSRIRCAKNGDFVNNAPNAQGYAWFVWQKGYSGKTTLGWF